MKKKAKDILTLVIGWPLSILALFFIAKIISPEIGNIWSHLKTANIPLLFFGILSFISYYFLRVYAWHMMLKLHGHKVLFEQNCFLWASSEMKRYIPGNIWSFVGRTLAYEKKSISKKETSYMLLHEMLFVVASCVTVALLGLPFFIRETLPNLQNQTLIIQSSQWIVATGVLLFLFQKRLTDVIPYKTVTNYLHALKPLSFSESLIIFSVDVLAFIFLGLGYFFSVTSLVYINPQLIIELVGFFVLSLFIGLLSFLTPTGLGVREGAITLGLSKIVTLGLSGFVALFSRMILIFSELLFLLFAILIHKVKHRYIIGAVRFLGDHKHEAIVLLLILIYILYFTTISFLRYDHFYTGRFDLGNMDQTVWNTKYGRIFQLTNPNGTETTSRLAFHSDFILVLLSPFYFLWENPKMLLLIQTVVVGSGAYFIYLLASQIIKNKTIAAIMAFLYLLNPSVQRTNIYDFHAVTLATTFLLGAYYFLRNKRYIPFLIFSLLAAITKEQVWFIVGLFGWYMILIQRKIVFGIALFTIGTLISYYLISYAIPSAHGSEHFALSYYSDYGDKPSQVIKNIFLSPGKTLSTILLPDRIHYIKQILYPLGGMSLIAPFFLLFAAPELIIYLLSSNAHLHQIYYQYTATITPFLFISAIYGVTVFIRSMPQKIATIAVSCYLLFAGMYGAYMYGPLPGTEDSNLDMITNPLVNKDVVDRYIASIPKHLRVAADNNVASHLSQRENIYVLPRGIEKADIVLYLRRNQSDPYPFYIHRIKNNEGFTKVFENNGFMVFERRK